MISSVSFILYLTKAKKNKDKITQEVRLWRTAISWSLVCKVRNCLKKSDDNCEIIVLHNNGLLSQNYEIRCYFIYSVTQQVLWPDRYSVKLLCHSTACFITTKPARMISDVWLYQWGIPHCFFCWSWSNTEQYHAGQTACFAWALQRDAHIVFTFK